MYNFFFPFFSPQRQKADAGGDGDSNDDNESEHVDSGDKRADMVKAISR
jgi:hypothetical protein